MFGRLGRFCLIGFWLALMPLSATAAEQDVLLRDLARIAPGLNQQALRHALAAMQCAVNHGADPARRLAVIDYSRPSTERRLWIFDLQRKRLLLRDFVAHGRKSGENFAQAFSNRLGSHQTSLGLFRTAESYRGKHGYSLRMDGLEPGLNDLARERAIVIHGAGYVNPRWAQKHGRIGRSLGAEIGPVQFSLTAFFLALGQGRFTLASVSPILALLVGTLPIPEAQLTSREGKPPTLLPAPAPTAARTPRLCC